MKVAQWLPRFYQYFPSLSFLRPKTHLLDFKLIFLKMIEGKSISIIINFFLPVLELTVFPVSIVQLFQLRMRVSNEYNIYFFKNKEKIQ